MKVFVPFILKVPLVIERKPAVFRPNTVCVPLAPGVKFNSVVLLIPLFNVTPLVCCRSVSAAPLQSKLASAAPVNVMRAPAVLALVLKSIVPLLVKLPPIDNECVVTVPAAFERNVAPAPISAFPFTVKVLAVVCSNSKIPETPPPTVKLVKVGLISIVTVAPSTIVALSPLLGTTPPTQVAGKLQSPPAAVDTIFAIGFVVWVPVVGEITLYAGAPEQAVLLYEYT